MTDPVDTAPLLIDDEDESVVEPAAITAPLEALLLMATEPMPTAELAQAVRAPVALVERALAHLAEFYDETGRGFELRYVGGGWRYWTRAEHAELIGGWLIEGQHAKLSQAALETLAVVAYLQPISRSRVSAVRGVNVDGVLRTHTRMPDGQWRDTVVYSILATEWPQVKRCLETRLAFHR